MRSRVWRKSRMKRLMRSTIQAVTAVSLAICLAVVGLWARSYSFGTSLRHATGAASSYEFSVYHGEVTVSDANVLRGSSSWELWDWLRDFRPPPIRSVMLFPGVH